MKPIQCLEKVYISGGKVDGAKYKANLEENLLVAAKDFEAGGEVHIPAGEQP